MFDTRKLIVGIAAACLITVAGINPASADDDGFMTSIKAGYAAFTTAFNAGDVATAIALYTDDATAMPPGGHKVHGHADIQALWQGAYDGGMRNLRIEPLEVSPQGRTAYEVGAFTFDMETDGAVGAGGAGKYVVIWHQGDDGQWRMHVDIWNLDPPPDSDE